MPKVQLNITYKGKYSYLTDPAIINVTQLNDYYKVVDKVTKGESNSLKVTINKIDTYFPKKFLNHCFLSVIILEE